MLLLDIKLHDVEKLIYITYDAELFTVSRVFNCKLRLQNFFSLSGLINFIKNLLKIFALQR